MLAYARHCLAWRGLAWSGLAWAAAQPLLHHPCWHLIATNTIPRPLPCSLQLWPQQLRPQPQSVHHLLQPPQRGPRGQLEGLPGLQVSTSLPAAGLHAAKLQCINMPHQPACLESLPTCQTLVREGRR
jgi:hypothetical protein